MSEEIFDIVDELDAVVGRSPRSEVHAQGLRHRAVHVLLFNRWGEVFLQQRSLSKDSSPGLWDSSASGHLNCGEGYDQCAPREVEEELGCPPPDLEPLFKVEACMETGQEFVWVYRASCEGPFTLHPGEIQCGVWTAPDQLTLWMEARPHDFAPALRLIWSRMRTENFGGSNCVTHKKSGKLPA